MTFEPQSLPSLKKDQVKFFAKRTEGVTIEFLMNRLKLSEGAVKGLIGDNRNDGVKVTCKRVNGVPTYFA